MTPVIRYASLSVFGYLWLRLFFSLQPFQTLLFQKIISEYLTLC